MASSSADLITNVLYFPTSDINNLLVTQVTGNYSGWGTTQALNLIASQALVSGAVVGLKFQVGSPAPLVTFCLDSARTDEYFIYTNDNTLLTMNPLTGPTTPLGRLNGQFQPGARESFTLLIKLNSAVLANASIGFFQNVIQNSIGQWIDLPSVSPPTRSSDPSRKTVVSTTFTVMGNTTSAIPNTLVVTIENLPVRAGSPVIPVVFTTLRSGVMYIQTSGLDSFTAPNAANAGRDYVAVANQVFTLTMDVAERDCYWSGRVYVVIPSIGLTTLVPTAFIPCAVLSSDFSNDALLKIRNQWRGNYSRFGTNDDSTDEVDGKIRDLSSTVGKLINMVETLASENRRSHDLLLTYVRDQPRNVRSLMN